MINLLLLIIALLFVNVSFAQTACDDQTLLAIKGSWKKRPDALMRADNKTQAIAHIDAISELFKTAYPQPKGMEAGWYRTMDGNMTMKNGPLRYAYNSLYLGWYCNQYEHKSMLGDETGTWAYAFVNYFSWFMSNQYDLLLSKINGQNVYLLPPVKGEWKGYPIYQASSHGDKGRCIILTRNNSFPWKTVTQEQYLQAVKSFMEKQKKKTEEGYLNYEENIKKGISDAPNNKYLTQDGKDKLIASLQKELENFEKRKPDNQAHSNKFWNDKVSMIDNYSSQNPSMLQRPAIIEQGTGDEFGGRFSSLEKGGQMLVTVDTAYFNKQLPRSAPQFIVLYWRWDKNAPGLNFKKEFEENFPVDKLKTMIDK